MATYFVGMGIESFVISPTLVTDNNGTGVTITIPAGVGYADAYLVKWESNVVPGILGRTCDRDPDQKRAPRSPPLASPA